MRKRYVWCSDCHALIRIDDGSYCEHYIAKHFQSTESVTVIFRGPGGDISFPWSHNSPCPDGYVREEIRGPKALRKLEKELDAKDIKRHDLYQQKVERVFHREREQRRRDLHDMVRTGVATLTGADGSRKTIHLTEKGRDLAREALRRSESGYSQRYDPGNHRDR